MAKITISPLTGSYGSVTAINNRLQQIEDAFNDDVLWRDGFVSEPNAMDNDLDMASNAILNLPAPHTNNSPARLQDVIDASASLTSATALLTSITDLGTYYTADHVEGALQELFDGTSDNATKTGAQTFTDKTLTAPILNSPVLNTAVSGTAVDTDDTLTADSDTLLVSQKAIKEYIRAQKYNKGDLYLIEQRTLPTQNTHNFPSVFSAVNGLTFDRYIIRFDDIQFSHDNMEFAFRLTYNDGSSYYASLYRPSTGGSYTYHSVIQNGDYVHYSGTAGASGEIEVRNSGQSSFTRCWNRCSYPRGGSTPFSADSNRSFTHDLTGAPTGFQFYQDDGAGTPIGTMNGTVSVYGVIDTVT